MLIQLNSILKPTVRVKYDAGYNHPVDLSFHEGGEYKIRVCLTTTEAKALAEQLLSACDAEPITPIVEFQDSTTNEK